MSGYIKYVSKEEKSQLQANVDAAQLALIELQHQVSPLSQKGNFLRAHLRGKPLEKAPRAETRAWEQGCLRSIGFIPTAEQLADIDAEIEALDTLLRERKHALATAQYALEFARVGSPPAHVGCGASGVLRSWCTEHVPDAPVRVVDGSASGGER